MSISEAVNLAAPYYNLAMVVVVIILFFRLFRTKPTTTDIFMKPWYVLFAVILVFVVEEVATVLRALGLIPLENVYINGFFELIIVSMLIYMMLLQKEHLAKTGRS